MLEIKGFSGEKIEIDDLGDGTVELYCTNDQGNTAEVNIDKERAIKIISHLAREFGLDQPTPPPAEFREGDEVTTIEGFESVVSHIDKEGNVLSVQVEATGQDYTAQGKDCSGAINRSVFHGHNLQFIVLGETTPTRKVKRWVNLYEHVDSPTNMILASVPFYTEEVAKAADVLQGMKYIKTVEIEVEE